MPSIEVTLRVRWADSDPAGRINFPRYFDYMEDGEAELMRSCGLSYGLLPAGYGVPRVHTDCTFKKILKVKPTGDRDSDRVLATNPFVTARAHA